MSNIRQKYDDEFKKNAVRLSYASNRTSTFASIPWEPLFGQITGYSQTCIKFGYFHHFRQIPFSVKI